MREIECDRYLSFLTAANKQQLNVVFKNRNSSLMPHQISAQTGLDYKYSLSLLTLIGQLGYGENKLLIYHVCDAETPATAIPFGTGFPNIPWACPFCEYIVEDMNELEFDLLTKDIESIKFI